MISVEINVIGNWTLNDKQSEVEVGIIENNKYLFLLTYGTPLIDGCPLHKHSGTLTDTKSSYNYYLGGILYQWMLGGT